MIPKRGPAAGFACFPNDFDDFWFTVFLSGGRSFFGPAGNACFTKGFEAFWGTVFLAHVTRNGPSKVSPFHLISESRSIDHNGRETDDFPLAEALFALVL